MAIKQSFPIWWIFLSATAVTVIICVRWFDVPVALLFLPSAHRFTRVGTGLSGVVLVAAEAFVMFGLSIIYIARGTLPEVAKALFVSCCASLSAFAFNDYVLKFAFGRENTSILYQEIPNHVFLFFQGDQHSSFPSGHMVMASAFAATMVRLQSRTLPVLIILIFISAAALVIGDWHFISDIIAGAFVGGTAGFVAGGLWLEYIRRHSLN